MKNVSLSILVLAGSLLPVMAQASGSQDTWTRGGVSPTIGQDRLPGWGQSNYRAGSSTEVGSVHVGSCDVHGRDGSIELRSLQHGVIIPTDPLTGKVTGSRQHCSFNFTKEIDSSSPYLFKAVATGQTLKSAEFNFYRINYSGQEEIYYIITLENVRVVHYSPVMHDTRSVTGTGHMEDISLSYEKITHLYKDGNILHSDSWNEKYGCH